ncbi:MAG: GIY-YIG nuclease family protein [Pseudomonadota bacterium]
MMYYVYMLHSIPNPDQTYIGFTENLKTRLASHNSGQSSHTAKFKPWELITYLAFSNRSKALSFEKYLKSHSGKAFANKRLW